MLDKDESGELDAEEFVQGIQAIEGQLSESQCTRLMEITDVDNSGTIDFNELTKALQKLDLRVDLHDYILVCLRFWCSEMQRTAGVLRSKFQQASKKEGVTAASPANELSPDGVKALLKQVEAPFTPSVLQRMIIEMGRDSKGLAIRERKRSSGAEDRAAAESSMTSIACEPFVRSVMANGFHAVANASFKEMGQALNSATQALMAVNAFSRKLGALGKQKGVLPAAAAAPASAEA
uniref:EF-hand domain-containing protein n=1 Tax=Haptolina brevifila TaxID=156173 RepID=A0A7S2FYK7_9EUKA|mmetsp:Transcript_22497/g.45169  ORF Transcript_22497/g.45169 Transcript_22497/m.45169 type:complete len:236 (+) Transcript_22497:90-797(+)